MVGQPTQRRWYETHDFPPGRPVIDDDVRDLLARIDPHGSPVDLGGSTSLNLLLKQSGLVLRVNKPFITARRIRADQDLRHFLASQGLNVARPATWQGRSIFRCGRSYAQLQQYVPHGEPTMGPQLFAAIGRLHSALAAATQRPPRPRVTSYVSPRTLHRWLEANRAAGLPRLAEPGVFADLQELLRMLRRQFVPSDRLPTHLIHGDAHPDNIRQTANGEPLFLDFDGVTTAPRIHDIAYALAFLLFWHDGPLEEFRWHAIPEFLAAYDRAAAFPLVDEERFALPAYVAAIPIYYDICDWSDQPIRNIGRWILEHSTINSVTR